MIRTLGKFEGELYATRYVYDLSVDGGIDEDIGESDALGWYGRFSGTIRGRGPFHIIISENSQGFVHGEFFDTEEQMNAAWSQIETEYDLFYEERGET